MFNNILLVHKVVVIVFVAIYLVKTLLLLLNKKNTLSQVKSWLKIPEMLISTLFLLTGIYLLSQTVKASILLYVKLGLVVAVVPLGVIAFKKESKILATIMFVILIGVYGLAEINKKRFLNSKNIQNLKLTDGKQLYEQLCADCHGLNGDVSRSGASILKSSKTTTAEKIKIVKEGKGAMPSFNALDPQKIESIVEYITNNLVKAE